jgi:hypothetical protein
MLRAGNESPLFSTRHFVQGQGLGSPMIEVCTQCKQKAEMRVDQWVCDYCESKAEAIRKEFGRLVW